MSHFPYRLDVSFFRDKSTLNLARDLLGKVLVRRFGDGSLVRGVITETEAYTEEDEASHSFAGRRTERNRSMFLAGGFVYVYFIYGRYFCFNISAEAQGRGCAVLIRGLEIIEGIEKVRLLRKKENGSAKNLLNGPSKLCEGLAINRDLDGFSLWKGKDLFLQDVGFVGKIQATERIGISRAMEKKWRFVFTEFSSSFDYLVEEREKTL